MQLPDYWLRRPAMDLNHRQTAAFDRILVQVRAAGNNSLIDYTEAPPRWQFLCYLAEQHGIALHGTGDSAIQLFEPRQSNDLIPFGNQEAVYAAADGLWSMFFAVVDRQRYSMSVTNACIRLVDPSGTTSEPLYVFSVSRPVLAQKPWRTGFVYLLPPDTFSIYPSEKFGPYEVLIPQLASLVLVKPFARIAVEPADFPFLDQIRAHEDERLPEYARALQTGGPWPGASGTAG